MVGRIEGAPRHRRAAMTLKSLILRVIPVLLLAVLAPALQANQAPLGVDQRLLQAHNEERTALGLPPLQWNAKLAAEAAGWADHLSQLGALIHSGTAPDDTDGENLWAGTAGAYSPEEMVGLWRAEKKNFRLGIFPNNSSTGRLDDVGHYTQIVWRQSRQVGCAIAHSETDDFLVCRYAEGGNVMGQRPY